MRRGQWLVRARAQQLGSYPYVNSEARALPVSTRAEGWIPNAGHGTRERDVVVECMFQQKQRRLSKLRIARGGGGAGWPVGRQQQQAGSLLLDELGGFGSGYTHDT